MITTVYPGYVAFTDLPTAHPYLWDVSSKYPEGALNPLHYACSIQIESSPGSGFWIPWQPVVELPLSPVELNTSVAFSTYSSPSITAIAFRRKTPHDVVYASANLPGTQFNFETLQAHANQGMFAAVDWANRLGVDTRPTAPFIPAKPAGRFSVSSQVCWELPDNSIREKRSWEFSFAGGYLSRAHVEVHVEVTDLLGATTWVSLPVDSAELSLAPTRFLNNHTLYIDASLIPGTMLRLCISRRTPKGVRVSSPTDAARCTASSMYDSALYGLYVLHEVADLAMSVPQPCCDCNDYTHDPPPPYPLPP
jgi:hypothetical protein